MNKIKRRLIKQELWAKTKICYLCGKQLPGEDKSTIDHILPKSKGGTDSIENLALVHWKCNNLKGDKCLDKLNDK